MKQLPALKRAGVSGRLSNPVSVKAIEEDGSIILGDGETCHISGIDKVEPAIKSMKDIERYYNMLNVKNSVDIITLDTISAGKKCAEVYVAVYYKGCGVPFMYRTLFPKDYPMYRKRSLAELILYVEGIEERYLKNHKKQ